METKYKKLTSARGRGFAIAVTSRSSLWLGDDHLLCVDSSNFNETYKRFYFRDIQAVLLQRTQRGLVWNIISGIAAAIGLIVLISTMPGGSPFRWPGGDIAGGILLGVFFLIFAVVFMANLLAGATCKTYIRTAVQTEELPSLCRVRKANKILQQIRPLIVAAQGGQLPPDVASAWMHDLAAPSGTAAQPTAAGAPGVPPPLA